MTNVMQNHKLIQSDPMLPMSDYWTNDSRFTGRKYCEFEHSSWRNVMDGLHIHLWIPAGTALERVEEAGSKIEQNAELKNCTWSWSHIPKGF